jgi:hypothetical protein
MTEEEADALDEYYTANPPQVKAGLKGGFFTEHKDHIVILDDLSSSYIRSMAEATNKTPMQIVGEMVRQKLAASA